MELDNDVDANGSRKARPLVRPAGRETNRYGFDSSNLHRFCANFAFSFETAPPRRPVQSMQMPSICVVPAWNAGTQVNMDVSGYILASLDAGYLCRHDDDMQSHVLWTGVKL